MTTIERLTRWRDAGAITPRQRDAIAVLVRKERFSLFLELNALLYLGVLCLAGGVAWTVQMYSSRIGDAGIVLALTMIAGLSFYYCLSRTLPYSAAEVEAPNALFDYALYLGCVVFAIELGYLELRFELLRDAWDYYLLGSAALFFGLAYRFDNRLVLSLALSTLAGWFGVKLHHLGFGSIESLRINALAYGALIASAGLMFSRYGIKRHFLETYLHIAANVSFIALLSGLGNGPAVERYLFALLLLGAVAVLFGIRYRRFSFVAYGAIYAYLGISSELIRNLRDFTVILAYIVVSGAMVLLLMVYLARRFGREA